MPAGGNSFEFGVSGGTERSRLSRQGSRTVGALANVDLDADVVQEPLQGSVSGNTSVGNEAVTTEAAASINLTKNLVGSGIFTLPLCMSKASVLPGLLMLVCIGGLAGGSFILIAYICKALGCSTYREMAAKAFGTRTAFIVDIGIMLNALFGCLAYVILVCDFFEDSVPKLTGFRFARWQYVAFDTVFFVLPLSYLKDLSPLRIPSMIGLLIIAYIFFYVVGQWVMNFDESREHLQSNLAQVSPSWFYAVSVFTGAFKAHYNAPTFYRELGENVKAHTRVVKTAFSVALIIYAMFAVAGFGIFGPGVEGNILKSYGLASGGEPDAAILFALLGMAFSITLTYPLVFNSGRAAVYGLAPSLERAKVTQPTTVHVVVTTSMVACIAVVGCFVRNVQVVVGLTGATIGMGLCLLIPGFGYLAITRHPPADAPPLNAHLLKADARMTAFSYVLVIFGCISVVLGSLVVLGVIV